VLTKANEKVQSDVAGLNAAKEEEYRAGRKVDYLGRLINTIKLRDLLSYLSNNNVIPKYGFPVDVVELTLRQSDEVARQIELTRDLRQAVSEYAPGGEVVANGYVWTSRYLRTMPKRAWPLYEYAVCKYCGRYHSAQQKGHKQLTECTACHKPFDGRERGTFVVPEFGFTAATGTPRITGETLPERTYASHTYFTGDAEPRPRVELRLYGTTLVAEPAVRGKLALVNDAGHRAFLICHQCGYAAIGGDTVGAVHPTSWGRDCRGALHRLALGHEFQTDVLDLRFNGVSGPPALWYSLLYAMIEGACEELDIERNDLDGVLYSISGDSTPAMVLYDDVPGGAGHVHRIARDETTLLRVFERSLARLQRCECGGDLANTSCYGCLRTFRNQYFHQELQRGLAIEFLRSALADR
jgi:hypothetical protein